MAEECIHLLNPAWCAECNGTAAQQKLDTSIEFQRVLQLPGWFPSRHPGFCCCCKEKMDVGTPIHLCTEPGHNWKGACCAPAGEPA